MLLRWPRVNRAWDTGPGGATGHRPSATPKWPDEIEKKSLNNRLFAAMNSCDLEDL